jgi:hypothetical protein
MTGENPIGIQKRSTRSKLNEQSVEQRHQQVFDYIKHLNENPPPEPTDEELVCSAKSALRTHIGADEEHPSDL